MDKGGKPGGFNHLKILSINFQQTYSSLILILQVSFNPSVQAPIGLTRMFWYSFQF